MDIGRTARWTACDGAALSSGFLLAGQPKALLSRAMTLEPTLENEVIAFWREAGPKRWFAKDDDFDAEIRERFLDLHLAAARGELNGWMETAEGCFALLLLTDQFPRNLFRGSAHAFATDPLARAVAEHAIEQGFDKHFDKELRAFFYLPFEHGEDLTYQDRSVELFETLGDKNYSDFAVLHRALIVRFGRFPHRNPCMGRVSTAEEEAYLADGGFAG
jgi:uncharacterized protein (DUF924 family)